MKMAVCVCDTGVDTFGYLSRYAFQFLKAATSRGVEVEIVFQSQPDFCQRLWKNLSDEDCIVHFYGYVFDLRIGADENKAVSAVGVGRAKTIATIGDHPFSTFMQATLQGAQPNTSFIVLEKSFQDQMQTLRPDLMTARYDYQPIAPPLNYDPALCVPFADRDYDLVVPMYMTDMSGHDIRFILSKVDADWFAKVMAATYEISTASNERSPFHIFEECLQEKVGLTFSEILQHNPKIVRSMLMSVAAVDGLVRQERRQRMVNNILRSVGSLKVAVTCERFSALDVDESVTFLGRCNIDNVIARMANSRAILNCNPSYPSGLHERLISGMFYQSCVITDVNQAITDTFSSDEYVRRAPDSSMTLEDVFSTYDVQAVAQHGFHRVRRDPAFSWDSHIDGLLRVAA